jgi:FdhE protein
VPGLPQDRPAEAPLLHGAALSLDVRPVRRWVRRLVKAAASVETDPAGSLGRLKARQLDAVALLEAGVRQDHERIRAIAEAAGADAGALTTVAQFAVVPLLQASARRHDGAVPKNWSRGYCPVCGAWPAFGETRGLDRSRHLRCGRCGGDWVFSVLHCPYCDERDHKKLASLVPEGEEDLRRADTCSTCKGYVKSVTTLQAVDRAVVLLEDLNTVELDLAAIDRGFSRPERPGCVLDFRIEPARRRFGFLAPDSSKAGSKAGGS